MKVKEMNETVGLVPNLEFMSVKTQSHLKFS